MNAKSPKVVRKIKLGSKWVFANVTELSGRLDFTRVTFKGNTFPVTDGSFHLDYTENGKRRRPCLGTDPAAVKRALVTQRQVLELRRRGMLIDDAPEIQKRAEGKTLASVLADFSDAPPAGLGARTVTKYRGILRDFIAWAAVTHITHVPMVTDAVMERWIRHLRDKQMLGASTIGDKVVQVAGMLKRHGGTFNLRPTDLPRVTYKERDIYTHEILRAIFAACKPPEYALFQTFLLTGMREQEVAFLADTDIDAKRSLLRVTAKPQLGFTPKNYCERTISVPRRLIDLLQAHLGTRKGLVFATSDIWAGRSEGKSGGLPDTKMLLKLKRLARRAGLNCGRCVGQTQGKRTTCATHPICGKFGLHKFRHTYATSMLRDHMDIESLRKQLGHADLTPTRRYLHALEPEALQAEVEVSSLAAIV